jgi:hypothetical protein
MGAILLLGWNEFVAVIWNPVYLILGFLAFMFGWMLYSELDVDARMQQGWVAGLLGIWSNLGDALRTVRGGFWRGPGCSKPHMNAQATCTLLVPLGPYDVPQKPCAGVGAGARDRSGAGWRGA